MNADQTCKIEECDKDVYARGWCNRHYQRWRLYGNPTADRRRVRKPCTIEGCERLARTRTWCTKHYQRWLDHGDPLYVKPTVCSIEGCDRPRKSKQGWCNMHVKRWQRHGNPEYQRPVSCSIPGCGRPVDSQGWCKMHYRRWERHGDPVKTIIHMGDPEDRLWSSVDRGDDEECWPWTGRQHKNGYSVVSVDGKARAVHRYVYEITYGPIPADHTIDHVCHDPKVCDGGVDCPHRRCCNPSHLEAVPPGHNNTKDRSVNRNRQKTHCKRGHAFTPDNTKITSSGGRACRRCVAMLSHQRYLRKKQAKL